MKKVDVTVQMRVAYIPRFRDIKYKDVEFGTVSSIGEKYIYVRFDKDIKQLGWERCCGEACFPEDLIKI